MGRKAGIPLIINILLWQRKIFSIIQGLPYVENIPNLQAFSTTGL